MSLPWTYAKALYESTGSNGESAKVVSEITGQLENLVQLLKGSKELRVILLGPATSSRDKAKVVDEIAKRGKFSPVLTRFLNLLARKGRLPILEDISSALREVALKSQGGILGKVVSADELSESDLKELQTSFEGAVGKKIEFQVSTDPELLAGVKVTVSGVTYDGTLRGQLNRVKESFMTSEAGNA